ncbi:hypothetical protein [Serratia marcescens]|uniref:hypothetical protein n=1 Tax=Serratia marcescens TaxID=615 RepID=UPI0034E24A8B
MFKTQILGALAVLALLTLLSALWWHGHARGFSQAKQLGEQRVSQLQEGFSRLEKQRAERELKTLRELQQRFERQLAASLASERNYLARIERLDAENTQLKRQIDDVTRQWMDEKGRLHPVSCVFTRGFVQHYNTALGVPDAEGAGAAATATGAGKTPESTGATDARLRRSDISQRDILANVTDNGRQCRIWREQVNGLLDYIEGLQQ